MNENKRPVSVLAVACLYIFVGTVGFVFHFKELLAGHPDAWGIEITELVALVSGIFLLRGQNWARWLALAWIVFRSPDLATARNVMGGLVGQGHSNVVSFSPLAAVALLLLFGLVWLMPNSMEMMWRHNPALPSPYTDQPVAPANHLSWRPTPIQAGVYGAVCILAVLAMSNLKPFIYFQF